MSKKVKYLSYAIALVLVAGIMTIAIWAATSASAGISANVSWTASAGIEFELEAWVVNNPAGNGIGNTSTPKSITKQIVTTSTSNTTANNLAGDLACGFYDGTNDGVNNPSNIVFTYKIKNTGSGILKVTATKTPNNQAESGTTAENHKPAVALSSKLDSTDNTSSCISSITGSGFSILSGKTLEYIVTLSIANADLSISSFDAGVTFSFGTLTAGTPTIYVNGVQQSSPAVAGAITVGDYLDALDGSQYPGYFYDEDLTIYADEDDIVTNDTKLYTKPATLDKLTFTSNGDGTCSVSRADGQEGDFVIPLFSSAGDVVTNIASRAFYGCENITSVVIPESVKIIGSRAFAVCVPLTNIIIPNSVITIEDYAFNECSDLTNVVIGDGVVSIGVGVFTDAPIATITVAIGNTSYDSRNNCNALIETSTNTLIKGCNTSFIPYGITSIGDNAFSSCSELLEIEIPDSVISIGERAFNECVSLTSITIPDSVTSIGDSTFSNCISLTSITIPDSVTSIGDSTFSNCISLTSITIPDTVASIGDYAFSACFELTSITIPDSVTSIGELAFYGCTSLTSIYIPSSVTTISAPYFRSSPFDTCSSSLRIYCGASSEPSGWDGNWNYYDGNETLSVTWGVTREQYNSLYA